LIVLFAQSSGEGKARCRFRQCRRREAACANDHRGFSTSPSLTVNGERPAIHGAEACRLLSGFRLDHPESSRHQQRAADDQCYASTRPPCARREDLDNGHLKDAPILSTRDPRPHWTRPDCINLLASSELDSTPEYDPSMVPQHLLDHRDRRPHLSCPWYACSARVRGAFCWASVAGISRCQVIEHPSDHISAGRCGSSSPAPNRRAEGAIPPIYGVTSTGCANRNPDSLRPAHRPAPPNRTDSKLIPSLRADGVSLLVRSKRSSRCPVLCDIDEPLTCHTLAILIGQSQANLLCAQPMSWRTFP